MIFDNRVRVGELENVKNGGKVAHENVGNGQKLAQKSVGKWDGESCGAVHIFYTKHGN